jgi:hypothetical protein
MISCFQEVATMEFLHHTNFGHGGNKSSTSFGADDLVVLPYFGLLLQTDFVQFEWCHFKCQMISCCQIVIMALLHYTN